MIDFAHEEVLFFFAFPALFLALLGFGDALQGADEGYRPPLAPVTLEIRKPKSFHPANLAISPPNPELGRGAPRIDGIERGLKVRPNHCHVVWMHQLHDLFDTRLVLGKIENLLRARIAGEHTEAQIVPVRPELGYIEGNLQTIFALAQPILCCLSPGGGPPKLCHQRVALSNAGFAQRHRSALSQSDCSTSRAADR